MTKIPPDTIGDHRHAVEHRLVTPNQMEQSIRDRALAPETGPRHLEDWQLLLPDNLSYMPSERLQKIIAAAGIASRRSAEKLISSGAVSVNGTMVTELGRRLTLSTITFG